MIGWKGCRRDWLLCFLVKYWQGILLDCHQFDCFQDEVWWVSIWNSESLVEWEERKKKGILLYFVLKHWKDILLLLDQSNWKQDKVWRVSVWNRQWMTVKEYKDVTLFCFRALARCCAPWSPIGLLLRWSIVSVYMK